jgi:hypothetical protein
LASTLASDIFKDISELKESIQTQNKKFAIELKQISGDSSDKANQLSLYIDEQIQKIKESIFKEKDRTKSIFTKLAEQFKNHLLSYENWKKLVEIEINELRAEEETARKESLLREEDRDARRAAQMEKFKIEIEETVQL